MLTTARAPRALGRAAAAGVAAAVIAVCAGTPAAAAPAVATSGTSIGAAWLVAQLTGPNHDHYVFAGTDFADDGNTADGVLALDAAQVAQTAAARMTAWLESDVANYAGTAPNYYPGSLAKLLLVAEAQHRDIHDFGGVDLVAALLAEETAEGLYADPDAQYGYESTISQALAVIALSNTGSPSDAPDAQAVAWLVDQQCPDGGFRNNETPHTVTDCTSDVDTTAFAIQALLEANQDAAAALTWLRDSQNTDGGFGAPDSDANSTAVSVQALIAAGDEPSLALNWLHEHQIGNCDDPADEIGAILFKGGDYDQATALRATTQGLQAIALAPLAWIDAADASDATPAIGVCVPDGSGSSGSGGNGNGHGRQHRHHTVEHRPLSGGAIGPQLPATGPAPMGPTAGIAVDCFVVGGVLLFVGRRRRSG